VGDMARGRLELPRLAEGELWASALDLTRSGTVLVAGNRVWSQAISRARALSVAGLIAASAGQAELRDLAASVQRQRAGLGPSAPFGLLVLDGYGRRPMASPLTATLSALSGRSVSIVTDPPLLVFDEPDFVAPSIQPEWVRLRGGANVGLEGRLVASAGFRRFRAGLHLESGVVVTAEGSEVVVPLVELERFTIAG
jgi:hypothetical protein